MAGKFELKKSKNDKYFFSLLASNGQKILASEMYEAKASALNGIESVKKMRRTMAASNAWLPKTGRRTFHSRRAMARSSEAARCMRRLRPATTALRHA